MDDYVSLLSCSSNAAFTVFEAKHTVRSTEFGGFISFRKYSSWCSSIGENNASLLVTFKGTNFVSPSSCLLFAPSTDPIPASDDSLLEDTSSLVEIKELFVPAPDDSEERTRSGNRVPTAETC